jgi:hypothetical protein
MSACGQPTEKRPKRARNPFTAEESVVDVSAVGSMENATRQLAHAVVHNRIVRCNK